jgi:hypothetical protein
VREPDATFSDPRQAVLYDVFNNDPSDLEAYVTIADEVLEGITGWMAPGIQDTP